MSINADYLNYLVNGGDFDSLPIPTSIMGIYLRQLCIKIDNLPVPMVFKGTLGVGGSITQLPTASVGNTGHTYKVITDGTYAGVSATAGDEFISDGTEWLHIPSGNDPASLVDYDDTETQLGATNVQQAIEKLNSKPSGAGVDYSLDEVNTGIKWIDGKPIYRKVIYGGYLKNVGTLEVECPDDADVLVTLRGIAISDYNTERQRTLPFADGVNSNCIRIDRVEDNICRIITYTDWSDYQAWLILEYTKTTD